MAMFWRLPGPVRALVAARVQRRCYSTTSPSDAEPLRILFCGSDAFSIASLDALVAARDEVPGLIDDIHVVHRPAKPTGRGLKTMREVPLSLHARSLSLPTHALDTFTSFSPPTPTSYNLIIAVSFGLLIPSSLLTCTRHGGLNVHPSLLPDLRGAAPIQHALLKQRSHTGVSVQTLHPSRFDAGVVLAQSEAPGVRIGRDEGAGELEGRLARIGARMLVEVLKARAYVHPVRRGWYGDELGPVEYAGKIVKADHFVDFATMTLQRILATQRALGDTWCVLASGDRLVVHELVDLGEVDTQGHERGMWVQDGYKEILFRAKCGSVGGIRRSTFAGGAKGKGNKIVRKMFKEGKLKVGV